MSNKQKKTNAMRILEQLNIPYETASYEVDENNLDAIHAAEGAGLEKECVYKTIVMQAIDKSVFVFCLAAEDTISLKKARAITGVKDIDLIKMDILQKTTGYIRGGCSPLGMKKKFPTFISEMAQLEEYIYVSAGQRGLQLKLKPDDLLKATDAIYEDFIQ
ncbi:MAG: Cys-tRNA(Pro) deacylase [Sphaerochaetaceae bacterium]|nr:Cys-tRNA(Pro) deacylase [Sphaerochaetaceae bacterium]